MLGAYRGYQIYNNKFNTIYKRYTTSTPDPFSQGSPKYDYLECYNKSIYYFAIYIFPLTAPSCIMSESTRL
jgi:hypothetical protein